MKIVFIYPTFESLGIEYLSAYLKKHGHQTKLILDPQLFVTYTLPVKPLSKIFNFRKNIVKETVSLKPEMVCFSCASDVFGWAIQLAEAIKGVLDVPIVFGGPHPTAVPENVIKHKYIDFVIVGEGEEALLELADKLENGKDTTNLKNVWSKYEGKIINNPVRILNADLDSLPFPDKDLYYNDHREFINNIHGLTNTYGIMGSRGCPNACSYCQNNYLQKLYKDSGYLRFRSVTNIIEELAIAKERYNVKTITFWDNILTYNKKWLRELLERYKEEISLPFVCYSYPGYIDKETVSLLEESGCRIVDLGIQSINENIRKDVLLRRGSNDDIIKTINLISRSKLLLYIDLMVGLPRETGEDLLNTAKFFNRHKVNLINIHWLRHFPKTEITKYIENKDMITKINEGAVYAPYQTGGSSFDKDKAKLIYLVIIANFISSPILRFLLRIKAYRFFPSRSFHYAGVIFSLGLTNIFSRNKYAMPQLPVFLDFLRYHKHYIFKFFGEKFKRFTKRL